MTIPSHVVAGLIIGHFSGNYALSLTAAVIPDIDHIPSYLRHKVLFKPGKLMEALKATDDPWGDQRGLLHNILVWLVLSLICLSFLDLKIALVLSAAYLSHLVLDALDNADYYPFAPSKKGAFRGPIGYFSKSELVFSLILLVGYALAILK
jgi:membrane-bound metal-dependent hydrolase YbcI (DUF457 family)